MANQFVKIDTSFNELGERQGKEPKYLMVHINDIRQYRMNSTGKLVDIKTPLGEIIRTHFTSIEEFEALFKTHHTGWGVLD